MPKVNPPTRPICVGTENEYSNDKWIVMAAGQRLKRNAKFGDPMALQVPREKKPKVETASIVIFRATQYKVCVCF